MKWRRQPPGEMGDHVPQTAAVRVFYPPIQYNPFVNHACVLLELDDIRPFTRAYPPWLSFYPSRASSMKESPQPIPGTSIGTAMAAGVRDATR
jgi:hypothetical protein